MFEKDTTVQLDTIADNLAAFFTDLLTWIESVVNFVKEYFDNEDENDD